MAKLTQYEERMAYEQMDIERLEKFVNEIVSKMASSSQLELREALDILENIHVHMIRELNSEVKAIVNMSEASKYMNPATLALEIEKAIKAISFATDLNTEEITTIFSLKPGASLEDVSYRLHRQSAHDRLSF